jgi:hypothetical protein
MEAGGSDGWIEGFAVEVGDGSEVTVKPGRIVGDREEILRLSTVGVVGTKVEELWGI